MNWPDDRWTRRAINVFARPWLFRVRHDARIFGTDFRKAVSYKETPEYLFRDLMFRRRRLGERLYREIPNIRADFQSIIGAVVYKL